MECRRAESDGAFRSIITFTTFTLHNALGARESIDARKLLDLNLEAIYGAAAPHGEVS